MATDLETLLVRIDATTEGLRRELKKADRAVDQSGRNMDKTLTRIDKKFSAFGKGLIAAFSVAAIAKVGKEMILAADRYSVLQGRIREATRATGDYAKVSAELFATAQRTGTALEDNVAMFQRLSTGAREFGATSTDILKVTETVQKLGIIGGTSTASISAGTMQFAQAMAAGVVRAEEWNSVVENMPELANAIATGMGKTVGQMREAVLAGRVLSKDVFNVLLKQGAGVAERFEKIPFSISQASTKLNNAMMAALGGTESMASATQNIAEAISQLADALPGIVKMFDHIAGGILDVLKEMGIASSPGSEQLDRMIAQKRDSLATLEGNAPFVRQSVLDERREELKRLMQLRYPRAYHGGQTGVLVQDKTGGGGAGTTGGAASGKADKLPDLIDGGFVGKTGAAFPIDESAWFDPQEQADRIARLKEEGDAVRSVVDPVFALAQETSHLQMLLDAGAISSETFGLALGKIQHEALLAAETMEGGFARALEGLEDSLSNIDWFAGNIFDQMKNSFKGMINDIINEAFRLMVIKPLLDGLFGQDRSKGVIGGLIGGLFGGGKAGGGPVTANTPYLVGEKGPEVFVPGSSGGIVPNHKMGGGMQLQQIIHVHFDHGMEAVDQRIQRAAPRIARAAAEGVRNANQRTAGAFIR